VRLAVITQHRFRGTPVAAKRLIADGAIGDVRMIHARGMLSWPELAPGHVPWAELGYHVCDLLRWFADSDVVDVTARFASYTGAAEPARSVMAVFRFATGVLGSVWLSYEVPPPGLSSQMQYQIVGSKGILDLDSYAALRLGTDDGWRVVAEQPVGDPADPLDQVRLDTYIPQFRDFEAAVRDHRRPAVDGEDARKTVQMLLAALASGTKPGVTPSALPSDSSLR
jgi:predicted dehydrogenase